MKKYHLTILSLFVSAAASLVGCGPMNDPYYGGGNPPGYGGGYYGGSGGYYGGGYDPYYNANQRERDRLDRERDRLEREREQLERDRQRERERDRWNAPPPPPAARPPVQDRCPPGFSPSENKCSKEERKRGCQDVRLNSGLGCVKR